VFNLSGSEIIVILLLALVILGPEKLPEAMRKAGRAYSELRKMANSFQSEVRSVMDEPVNELRGTADALRDATNFTADKKSPKKTSPGSPAKPAEPAPSTSADDLGEVQEPHDVEDPGEDVITRTLSGDVTPPTRRDEAGPEA
jgi:Tat protein translocase TatB subunit